MIERPLLVIYNPDQVSDAAFRNFVASSGGLITYWAQIFPNTIFVSARADAGMLTSHIHQHFPQLQFFVSDVSDKFRRDGFMPEGIWNLIYQSENPTTLAS